MSLSGHPTSVNTTASQVGAGGETQAAVALQCEPPCRRPEPMLQVHAVMWGTCVLIAMRAVHFKTIFNKNAAVLAQTVTVAHLVTCGLRATAH